MEKKNESFSIVIRFPKERSQLDVELPEEERERVIRENFNGHFCLYLDAQSILATYLVEIDKLSLSEEDKERFARMITEIMMNPKAHRGFEEEIDLIFKEQIYPRSQIEQSSET